MLRPFDLAARSLVIVGGLNWLSVAAGKADFVALAARSRRPGKPTVATRVLYGAVGAGALWSLARLIHEEAFSGRARPPARQVREAMSADATSVATSASVAEAARLLAERDIGSLPVVEDGRLVGVVTDRDLALRIVAEGRDPNGTAVGEIASREPVTVQAHEQLHEALHLMAARHVGRLPVVEEGRLVGVLTNETPGQQH